VQKTCNEIIDETLAAGYTLSNRAGGGSRQCFYIDPDTGCQCAVGRCCEAPQAEWYGPWSTLRIGSRIFEPDERDALLKPEYRGHSVFFWMELQGLHDNDKHWTETGLSAEGESYVQELRNRW
jgi:hypothetical protein